MPRHWPFTANKPAYTRPGRAESQISPDGQIVTGPCSALARPPSGTSPPLPRFGAVHPGARFGQEPPGPMLDRDRFPGTKVSRPPDHRADAPPNTVILRQRVSPSGACVQHSSLRALAKQSRVTREELDCFVASAPHNDVDAYGVSPNDHVVPALARNCASGAGIHNPWRQL